ncbi:MAG: hypothetical protein ACOYB1_10150 [Limnohabitans sp.]
MKKLIPTAIVWLSILIATTAWSQTIIKIDYNTGAGTPVQQVESAY